MRRTGNCWFYGRTESCHTSGHGDVQRQAEGLSLRSPPGATFILHCRWGFRAQGTEGGPEATHWDVGGAGKEALECPQLKQPGLRGRAGPAAPLPSGTGMWGAGVTRILPAAMGSAQARGASRPGSRLSSPGPDLCHMGQPCPSEVREGFGAASPGSGRSCWSQQSQACSWLVVKRVPARARVELVRDGGSQSWERPLLRPGEEAALPLARGGNVAQCNPFTAIVWATLGMGTKGWHDATLRALPQAGELKASQGCCWPCVWPHGGGGSLFHWGPALGLCRAGTC